VNRPYNQRPRGIGGAKWIPSSDEFHGGEGGRASASNDLSQARADTSRAVGHFAQLGPTMTQGNRIQC